MPADRLRLKTKKEKRRRQIGQPSLRLTYVQLYTETGRKDGVRLRSAFLLLLHIFLIFLDFQGSQAGVGHSCIFLISKQYFYGVCTKLFREYSLKTVVLRKQCKISTNIWTCVTLKWLFRRISRFSWNRIFSLIEDSLLPRKSLYFERNRVYMPSEGNEKPE